jgi:outer membrane lipoprotein-sorting protein
MMPMRRRILLAIMLLGISQTAAADPHAAVLSDADQSALSGIQLYLNGLKSLKGRFLQISADGKTTQGGFWLVRPGEMRFQYDPPSPLLLVAGQGKVVFYDSSLPQLSTIPLSQSPLGLLLRDTISLTGDVTVTDFHRDPGQLQVTLVKTASPGEGSLTMILNEAPLALVGWSVVDAQGQETRIRLSDIVSGGTYAASLFTFTDPALSDPNRNLP